MVAKILMGLVITIILFKILFVFKRGENDASYGIYFNLEINERTFEINDESLKTIKSFIFELVTLTSIVLIYFITKTLQNQIDLGNTTYLENKHSTQSRFIYRNFFIFFTVIEVLSLPDLLALPVLLAVIFILILGMVKTMESRNRMSEGSEDSDFKR